MHENRRPEARTVPRHRREARVQSARRKRRLAPSRTITENRFPGKWKVIYFYPKDFTFVCPTEIVGFAKLASDFEDRDAVLLAGSTDNEFVKLGMAARPQGSRPPNHWMFADTTGSLVDMLGIRDAKEGVALRATFIVDPDNVIQHVSVNNLNVGRNPEEVLRVLDGLQTDELCPCNRAVGQATLQSATATAH